MLEVLQITAPIGAAFPSRIKALVLDDSEIDRKRIRRFTEKSGLTLEFDEAPTIEAMASKLDSNVFDLILIDYHLAEGDGLEALKLIQNHHTNKSAATIMVTGQGQTQVAVSAFRQGCNDFVQKEDLTPVIMRDAVMNALQQTGAYPMSLDPHPMDMSKLVQAAMEEEDVRDLISAAVSDGVRLSMQSTSLRNSDPQYSDQFLEGFLKEDEFIFRN